MINFTIAQKEQILSKIYTIIRSNKYEYCLDNDIYEIINNYNQLNNEYFFHSLNEIITPEFKHDKLLNERFIMFIECLYVLKCDSNEDYRENILVNVKDFCNDHACYEKLLTETYIAHMKDLCYDLADTYYREKSYENMFTDKKETSKSVESNETLTLYMKHVNVLNDLIRIHRKTKYDDIEEKLIKELNLPKNPHIKYMRIMPWQHSWDNIEVEDGCDLVTGEKL